MKTNNLTNATPKRTSYKEATSSLQDALNFLGAKGGGGGLRWGSTSLTLNVTEKSLVNFPTLFMTMYVILYPCT